MGGILQHDMIFVQSKQSLVTKMVYFDAPAASDSEIYKTCHKLKYNL